MPFKDIKQVDMIQVDKNIRLRRVASVEWEKALLWYQNKTIMKHVIGNEEKIYQMDDIKRMYEHLDAIGELYFIEYLEEEWISIGDVTLARTMIPIVIGHDNYFGIGIGKKVILSLIERAQSIGLQKLIVSDIYHDNIRSKRLFTSLGFTKTGDTLNGESYVLELV